MMLRVVAEVLRRRHAEGWLVGGSVRDRESGRYSPDLDIAVTDDPEAVAAEVAHALDVPWFCLSQRHGACRVVGAEGHVLCRCRHGSSRSTPCG
jgi:tRNA nucleotidyltransferase/poly(A) polymerase